MAAAAICFSEQGFHGSSIEDICSRANMSKGLIYRYFSNKDQIIVEFINEYLTAELRPLEILIGAHGNLAAQFQKLIRAHVRIRADQRSAALFLEIMAEAARNTEIMQLVQDARSRVIEHVTTLVVMARSRPLAAEDVVEQINKMVDAYNAVAITAVSVSNFDWRTSADQLETRARSLFRPQ